MKGSPPLRFLAIVLGGWAAMRIAVLAPPWRAPPAGAAAAVAESRAPLMPHPERTVGQAQAERNVGGDRSSFTAAIQPPDVAPPRRQYPAAAMPLLGPAPSGSGPRMTAATATVSTLVPPPAALPPRLGPAFTSTARWSLSAWSFVRWGDSAPLAAGMLGGSQAGARLTYRLNRDVSRPLALSVRLSSPLRSAAGAEAALGLDWQPVGRVPIHLLAERRQALCRDGRSAFGTTLFGGVGDVRLGRFRLDSYAQAGLVGTRSRDPFADGSIRLSLPLGGRARLGAGAWAAAQPGLSRLDVGPQAAFRLPVADRVVTVAADWRLRVAGNAAPGSGPTLTVATDL